MLDSTRSSSAQRFIEVRAFFAAIQLTKSNYRMSKEGNLPYLSFAERLPANLRAYAYTGVLESLSPNVRDFLVSKVSSSSSLLSQRVPDIVGHRNHALSAWLNRFIHLYSDFHITFPDINAAPLLWRCVKVLGLSRQLSALFSWLVLICTASS